MSAFSSRHVGDAALAAAGRDGGLRTVVRDEEPMPSIAERLLGRGEGEIPLLVMLGSKDGEVELE